MFRRQITERAQDQLPVPPVLRLITGPAMITEPAMITGPAATMIIDIEEPGERLIVTPEADPQKAGKFTGRLAGRGEVIVTNSAQPLVDGARELIARGFAAGLLLTVRHAGAAHDSFRPLPIGHWAKVTYWEGEKRALQRARWMPRADMAGGQKSGLGPVPATSTAAPVMTTANDRRRQLDGVATSQLGEVAAGQLDEVAAGQLDEVAAGQLDEVAAGELDEVATGHLDQRVRGRP